jgi:putative transposase
VSCFRFIAAEKANYPISLLCRMLGVSRSGFNAWERRPPSERDLADAWLAERIREIHRESRQTYGARRVHAALRHRGVRVGRKRVERLMRLAGLSGLVPKRYRRTTIRVPGVRVADDLVERLFTSAGPDELWCADIKYMRSWQGWLYLAAVMDCAKIVFQAAVSSGYNQRSTCRPSRYRKMLMTRVCASTPLRRAPIVLIAQTC